jgi:hypothetical protein
MEIDLIMDRNKRLFPLETRASATLIPGRVENLNKWHSLAGKRRQKVSSMPISKTRWL